MSPLSPLDRWRLIKQGIDPSAPAKPVSKETPQSEKYYRKPGEPCPHPPDMRAVDEGPTIGRVTICLSCGCILDDPDLKS